jgi:hypothetical protein
MAAMVASARNVTGGPVPGASAAVEAEPQAHAG